jgi:putative IMPACT (imprinted ancient) family translation regulator
MASLSSVKEEPLCESQVADSRFLGFCFRVGTKSEALRWQSTLKSQYPGAAHVPVVWKINGIEEGFDEDDEPPNSVGPGILPILLPETTTTTTTNDETAGLAVVIVRYFERQLLGVTCGRLPQCYQSTTRLTIHRFRHREDASTPMNWEVPAGSNNIYGMGAGDCELILNVMEDYDSSDAGSSFLLEKVRRELDFGGFRGAEGEVLPRLQNLQADLGDNLIPVYRYPGNYNGQEWVTFDWAPTSLRIKAAVEQALQPLVNQTMNHCVTNYYRDGKDFIAHHSDKDLDLNQAGVIVSFSLGDERVLELRRRTDPKDVTRVALPHCSMLVLGPKTNQQFSHSILANEDSTQPRISLTLREVKTFLDTNTGRLFGQGVQAKSLSEIRSRHMMENMGWFGGFCALSAWLVGSPTSSKRSPAMLQSTLMTGLFATGVLSLRYWNNRLYQQREEQEAREFFSKKSMSGTKY